MGREAKGERAIDTFHADLAEVIEFDERLTALSGLIGSVIRPGDYCVHGRLFAPMPRIEAGAAGVLSFPIPPAQAQTLAADGDRAPYGRGQETIVDPSVRDCRQLKPDKLSVAGRAWVDTFADILHRTTVGLGCTEGSVTAELYKLLIYEPGGFFKPHRDTEKADGMVATLVISLPVSGTGGELIVRHQDRDTVVDMRTDEPSELVYAAFYADCEHEILPVTDGHRVCLVYNLMLQEGGGTPMGAPHYYTCIREGIETASPKCQSISGDAIDRAVGELLVALMAPVTLEVALQVQDELAARAEEADLWRSQRVQRAREEADLARQRFMQTHPDNRMVADVLEAEWNAKLRALDEAQRELERSRAEPGQGLDDEQRQRILALASNFPRLWNDPGTPHRERKRMARLLIDDVTLTKATRSLGVRLRGGATRQLTWVPERHVSEIYRTSDEVVAEVDRLLNDHTDGEIARILNQRGYRSGYGHAFNAMLVKVVRDNYALKSRYDRLRDRGLLTVHDAAARLKVTSDTVHRWRKAGLLRGHTYNDRPDYLIEIPDPPPTKQPRRELSKRRRFPELAGPTDNEVQCEA